MEARFDAEKTKKLIAERRFAEAASDCEAVLAREGASETDVKSALQLLGTCHYFEGRPARSIECFKKILAIDPKHTDAAISLSVMYNDIGKYDEASRIYRVANQSLQLKKPGADEILDRKFAIKHVELGDLYFKCHRYNEALEEYSKAINLDPSELRVRVKLAKVYAKKGFVSRSLQELQLLCHEHPGFLEGRIQLGLMFFSQGNVIDARAEWERALSQDPHNPEIQTYLEMARNASETTT
ncbi:MAG: tetratricopeptide repeat protein [Deltaproteobacteria bacterium]|nr:tetratricopeptide repeat protein [Deltaproteobacteria bacterium]